MTTAFWCVLGAALLPILWAGFAKAGGSRVRRERFDNARPREWLATLDGWPARANFAQQNQYESFPPFAAGVIIAQLAGAPQGTVDALAIGYVLARIAYGACYMLDLAGLRSLVWLGGLACIVGLFFAAA
jgi:uncharacterized MAPEG superfamily protein